MGTDAAGLGSKNSFGTSGPEAQRKLGIYIVWESGPDVADGLFVLIEHTEFVGSHRILPERQPSVACVCTSFPAPSTDWTGCAMEHASAADDSGSDDERHAHLLVLAAAKRRRRERQRAVLTMATWRVVLRSFLDGDELEDEGLGGGSPVKRPRRVLPRPEYRASFWWCMLGETGLKEPASRDAKLFRRRFRIPYQFFTELMELVKKKWFPVRKKGVAGRMRIPVELKVMYY
ncbi:unnamed protein product [Ectocarpus sp. CCAP 1310/34]|nr:unnamed protein product [Ectocarpus sp. CCAP 1310/34]